MTRERKMNSNLYSIVSGKLCAGDNIWIYTEYADKRIVELDGFLSQDLSGITDRETTHMIHQLEAERAFLGAWVDWWYNSTKKPEVLKAYKAMMLSERTDAELIRDWQTIDALPVKGNIPTVRGWLLDEIERRFPAEFDAWLEYGYDKDISQYIKTA